MHSIQRLPGAKIITGLLWIILLTGLLTGLVFRFLPGVAGLEPESQVEEHISLSVLRSETLAFLVTRRNVMQVIVEHGESNWLGQWRGVLWAVVTLRHGVDLTKITAQDIRHDGDVTIVKLPEPEVLDFAIEPGSVGFLAKSTAVPKVEDLLHNGHRRLLEDRLRHLT